jgi:hypothetical protein
MGTRYPAVMRLEQRGLVRGAWGTTDSNRKARFYSLIAAGRRQLEKEKQALIRAWTQVAEAARQKPGVESASVAGWAPLSGNRWTSSVRLPGEPFPPDAPYFVEAAPRYFETMGIGMIDGRDFRAGAVQPRMDERKQPIAGIGIVNEAFARAYLDGRNPVGRHVLVRQAKTSKGMEIVGLVRNAVYFSVRETPRPAVYVPVDSRSGAALIVRTAVEPTALVAPLRREVPGLHAGLRVRGIELQAMLVRQQMRRERLLAALSSFFALVALAVAAVGLYGVLNDAVARQRSARW